MISLSLPTLLKLFPFAYSRNQMMFLLLLLKSRTEIDHSFRIDVIFKMECALETFLNVDHMRINRLREDNLCEGFSLAFISHVRCAF